MPGASSLLARAWFRSQRRWWAACATVLALVATLVLVVQGTFAGIERATESRVADVFTGDVRVTPSYAGAAVQDRFPANQSLAIARQLEAAAGPGAHAVAHFESQFILSRRDLVQAYLEEHQQYEVNVPGGADTNSTAYGQGVLVGVPLDDAAAAQPLARHLVAGRMPTDPGPSGELQIAVSVEAFERYVSKSERAALTAWPPTAAELQAFHFEITALRVDDSGPFKDVIRKPAKVTGLFATRLEMLDDFVAFAPITTTQRLSGAAEGPNGAVNAFAITAPSSKARDGVAHQAQQHGWASEESGPFARRYIGQLLTVLDSLASMLAGIFFALPLFLLWYGLQQLLDRQRRELGVCRAIGVPPSILRNAILRLVVGVVLSAVVLAALAVFAASASAPAAFAAWALPVPVEFTIPVVSLGLVGAAVVVSASLAFVFALRRARLEDLAGLLRAS